MLVLILILVLVLVLVLVLDLLDSVHGFSNFQGESIAQTHRNVSNMLPPCVCEGHQNLRARVVATRDVRQGLARLLDLRWATLPPPKTPSRRCRGLSHRPVAPPQVGTWPVAPRVGGQAGLGPLLRNNLPINLGWARPVAPHKRIADPPERLLTATTPHRTPIEPAPFYLLVRHYN